MSSSQTTNQEAFQFSISPQDATLTEARISRILAKATREAQKEARADGISLKADSSLHGGFFGVGEIGALLLLAKTATGAKVIAATSAGAKILGKGVLGGIGGAGGKYFFDHYLAPRLRELNLLPSKFRPANEASAPSSKKKAKRRKRG